MPVRMDAMPSVGEHTDRILVELGLDAQEISKLCESETT
jgi:crotonobetainyl-CoA:carnitine CoA-transferase CaiB-like acyl-CoA transferase